jgi:type VI protein secretion system component Hcp
MSHFMTLATVCSSLLLAGPASAASDYLLEIDTIKGETSAVSPSKSIEVSSFSWGMSQAVIAPRDAASGMATGKRQHKPMYAVAEEQPDARTVAPATDSIKTFSLTVAEPGNDTAAYLTQICASGKHIPRAVLTNGAERYELTDVMVTSCAVTGNQRKHELTGHVTLIK